MNKIFICSPYRGDVEENTKLARKMGWFAVKCDYVPIIPHLVFPQFLDDNNPEERILGITMGAELLKICDCMWIIGTKLTKGMRYELEVAKKIGMPIKVYDRGFSWIPADTFSIDDRVNEEFIAALSGARVE